MDELHHKISDVLARLSTLSEAPTSNLDPTGTHGGAPDSREPPGVNVGSLEGPSDPDRPPSKERSLHDWWQWRFARALTEGESEFELHRLLLLAERDYLTRRYHVEASVRLRSGELTDNDAQDGGSAERAAAERVIDLYEGVPSAEVAVHEYTTESWVRKARRQHGRDPHDGSARAEFLDWPEDRRYREVAKLAAKHGQKVAADKLRVSRRLIRRYWPEDKAA